MAYVILLAGGIGSRVESKVAKQHIVVNQHQIIEYTLMAFSNSKEVDHIMVVSNPIYLDKVVELKQKYPKLKRVIPGGSTRMMSVYNGVKAISDIASDDDKIIISDAARPCITRREIDEIVKSLDKYLAVTTGISNNETILKIEDEEITQIISRKGIMRQTSPEGYKFSALRWLYLNNTDDIISSYCNIGIDQLFASGVKIGLVNSNPLNFKITTKSDIQLFESVLKQGFYNIINV